MKSFRNSKQGDMNDSIGKTPKIESKNDALKLILQVSEDKRSHVMLRDAFDWLNLKMKEITKIAKIGLNRKK